ncbi:hypothetical protein [Nocardia sp. X0981]
MSVQRREVIRDLSAAVFGNRYMVDVVSAITRLSADNDALTVRMIARATAAPHTQVPDGLVKQVVKRLVDAGFLDELPRTGPRAPLYHRLDRGNRAWTALAQLSIALEAGPAADSHGTAETL